MYRTVSSTRRCAETSGTSRRCFSGRSINRWHAGSSQYIGAVYVSGQDDDVLANVDLGRFVPSTKEPAFFFSKRATAEMGLDGYARFHLTREPAQAERN